MNCSGEPKLLIGFFSLRPYLSYILSVHLGSDCQGIGRGQAARGGGSGDPG